jgi:hypothetical protein
VRRLTTLSILDELHITDMVRLERDRHRDTILHRHRFFAPLMEMDIFRINLKKHTGVHTCKQTHMQTRSHRQKYRHSDTYRQALRHRQTDTNTLTHTYTHHIYRSDMPHYLSRSRPHTLCEPACPSTTYLYASVSLCHCLYDIFESNYSFFAFLSDILLMSRSFHFHLCISCPCA